MSRKSKLKLSLADRRELVKMFREGSSITDLRDLFGLLWDDDVEAILRHYLFRRPRAKKTKG